MNNMRAKEQAIILNQSARKHELQGNLLLAKWMLENAIQQEKIARDIDIYLDRAENNRTKVSDDRHMRTYNGFRSEWNSYEEEYLTNWDRS